MRSKLWVWALLLMGIAPTGYLLWQSSRSVDSQILEKFQEAEAERHAFVISSDFDLLKENLIEVHRDYWLQRVVDAEQARLSMFLLGGIFLLLILLIIKLWRSSPSPSGHAEKPIEPK